MAAIREAIVLAAPEDGAIRVGGVPLLVRTVLVLQRAGVERCTVVGGAAAPADPRIRCAVASARVLAPPVDGALRFVVGPGTLVDERLVRDLQARARPGEVLELASAGARVRVAPGPLVFAGGVRAEPPAAGTLAPAAAPGLARRLLGGLENPHDGWLDRALYRHGSRPLTVALLATPLTPNAVSLLGIAIGVAGGLLLGASTLFGVAAGVACLVVSGVLDCSDGELARLRLAESRLGHWIDITGDTVVHLAVLAGVARHLARAGAAPGGGTLAALGLGILGAFAAITWSHTTEARRHRLDAWENGVLDGILTPLSTRDWHVFVVAFALAGRLDWLVAGAAVGAHVFWLATVWLTVRVLRRA